MPTTYTNGLKLPDLGSIDWFNAYKNNIDILDPIVGTVNGVATTYAPISHNHDASEITSGTLDSARIPNLDASKITSGTIDIARLPSGALERLVTVADQTARYALTTSSVQLGDTVKQLDTGIMYYVVDTSKLNSADGYSEYTAGSATSVPWSGVTGKPSSFTPSSHSHGNITSAGAIGSTANKPLITTTNGVVTTGSFGTTANTFCQGNDSRLSDARTPTAHTHSASDITSGLATVATSGSYADLTNKPTIPTVNNATLTIQKNGTTVKTFTANASSNVTANITVPTKTSDLTNDSHSTITMGTDTTSTQSATHGGTFTCIDGVTKDTNGHITAVNVKTVTLPSDNNTDTLVTQNVSTANENHPVLLSVTKDATTNQGAKTSIFASGVKVNPSTNTVTATTFSGALSGNASSATQFSVNKDVTLTGDVTGSASSKAGWSIATTLANSGVTAGTYGPSADVTGNNNATISVPQITVDAKGRVTSIANKTLTCKNNTYTVNNATLTIQKNGTNVATFTSNASANATANITVPTKTSELTNDSGYLTSHQSLANYSTLTNTVKSLSISGKTITVTPGSGSAYTLTTQDTTYSAMSASEATTGTATTARSITAKVLEDKITERLSPYVANKYDNSYVPNFIPVLSNFISLSGNSTYPNGFNDLVVGGTYHVSWDTSVTGYPHAKAAGELTDGVLFVTAIRSSAYTSNYSRVLQKYYRMDGSTSQPFALVRRSNWDSTNSVTIWSDWILENDDASHVFTGSHTIQDVNPVIKNTNVTRTAFPSSTQTRALFFNDSADNHLAYIHDAIGKTGNHEFEIAVTTVNASTNTTYGALIYTVNTDGTSRDLCSNMTCFFPSGTNGVADLGKTNRRFNNAYINHILGGYEMQAVATRTAVKSGTWAISCRAHALLVIDLTATTSTSGNYRFEIADGGCVVGGYYLDGAGFRALPSSATIIINCSGGTTTSLSGRAVIFTTATTLNVTCTCNGSLSSLSATAYQ